MSEKKLHPFDIEEMISREDDPKARAYLISLSSLHRVATWAHAQHDAR